MPSATQERRLLAVETPLGADVLLLTALNGREEMSRLFSYRLEMLSDRDYIAPHDIIGKNVSFRIGSPDDNDGPPRFFNGYVSRFTAGESDGRVRHYEAEVVPWLWFLTRKADCRIFQDQTVPEIIQKIFKELGFTDFESAEIKGSHPKWSYCVQYRETDFNFVSRLMEHEGIFYYFRHEEKKHVLVLADQKGAYKNLPESEVEFYPAEAGGIHFDRIMSWSHQFEFRSGKWAQTDYNFEIPKTNLMTTASAVAPLPGADKYELYDYPGEYEQKADGHADSVVRIEEEETPVDVVRAAGTCRTFSPGGKFKLTRHDSSAEQGKSFAVTAIQHSATEPTSYADRNTRVDREYWNSFLCIPDTVVFRPQRTTPKPLISGLQTAVVVGPSGEEIYVDKYGRVKVQFFWDRQGKRTNTVRAGSAWPNRARGETGVACSSPALARKSS